MDADDVRKLLREEAEKLGGVTKWARAKDVPGSVVSDILNNRREPTPQVLDALDMVKVTDYQWKKDANREKA
jgi:hypothetical protein